jgi:hypothetical protein
MQSLGFWCAERVGCEAENPIANGVAEGPDLGGGGGDGAELLCPGMVYPGMAIPGRLASRVKRGDGVGFGVKNSICKVEHLLGSVPFMACSRALYGED